MLQYPRMLGDFFRDERLLRLAQRALTLGAIVTLVAIEYLGLPTPPMVDAALIWLAGALGVARPSDLASRTAKELPSAQAPAAPDWRAIRDAMAAAPEIVIADADTPNAIRLKTIAASRTAKEPSA